MPVTIPKIDLKFTKKLQKTIALGLVFGAGDMTGPGELCLLQAISFARGYSEDSDRPRCVLREMSEIGIEFNDDPSLWETDKDRAAGLFPLALAILGTQKPKLDLKELCQRLFYVYVFICLNDLYCKGIETESERRYEAVLLRLMAADFKQLKELAYEFSYRMLFDSDETRFLNRIRDIYYDCINKNYSGFLDRIRTVPGRPESTRILLDEIVKILIDMKTPGSKYIKKLIPEYGT